jgi:hypothetical protein
MQGFFFQAVELLSNGDADRTHHLLGILLRPVGLRPRQADRLLAGREDATAAIEHERAARVGALIDPRIVISAAC